jgi:hypothetical protein
MPPESERVVGDSPQLNARIAGVLWLTCIVSGIVSFAADSSLTVRGNAAATAAKILANEPLFRISFAADVVSGLSYVGVTALLYYLLKPVGRSLSALAAFFGVAGVAVGGVAWLLHILPVVLLRGDAYLTAFTTTQLQAVAFLAAKLRMQVFTIGMAFFGLQCFFVGYLISRSTFLPRALGILLALGGACYVIVSFTSYLAPSAGGLVMIMMPIALVGEGSLTAWLLVKGVDVRRWESAARTGAARV